jgi:hypothetical protein
LVLAGVTAGLKLHRILDICFQAVANGQAVCKYRKLKKSLVNAVAGEVGASTQMSGKRTYQEFDFTDAHPRWQLAWITSMTGHWTREFFETASGRRRRITVIAGTSAICDI